MMSTELAPAETDLKSKLPPMKHVRCCKPALPKGLCRTGDPPAPTTWMFNQSHPDACKVCWDLWLAHEDDCPRDSGRWM